MKGKKRSVKRREDGAGQGARDLTHRPGWSLGGRAVPPGPGRESPGPRDWRGSLAAPQPTPWRNRRLLSQKDCGQPGFGAIHHLWQFQECEARGEGRGPGGGCPAFPWGSRGPRASASGEDSDPQSSGGRWLVGNAHCLPGAAVSLMALGAVTPLGPGRARTHSCAHTPMGSALQEPLRAGLLSVPLSAWLRGAAEALRGVASASRSLSAAASTCCLRAFALVRLLIHV